MFAVTSMNDFSASAGILFGAATFSLDSSDGHPDFFDRRWSDIYRKVYVCCFYVRWIQRSWPIRQFFSVLLICDCFALFVLDGSLVFYISLPVSSLSYSCFTFPFVAAFSSIVARSSTYFRLSALMLFFTCFFCFSVFNLCLDFLCSLFHRDLFLMMMLLTTQNLLTRLS